MASIRQQIIDKIESRLGTILVSNGYETNIGNNVFPWLMTAPTSLPAAVFRDPTRDISVHNEAHLFTLSVEVEVFGAAGFTDDDIRKMVQDVVRAFGTDATWDGLALDTNLVSDCAVIDTQANAVKSGLIKFTVTYRGGQFSE
jgi:hypothetical protein